MSDGLIGYHYRSEYGVSEVQQQQQVLRNAHNRLVNATDPWHAYYYMVSEQLDVQSLGRIGTQVDMLASQLDQMSWFTQEAEKIKAAFFAPHEGGASGITDPDSALRTGVGRLINALVGPNTVPQDGSAITYSDLQNALSQVGAGSNTKLYSTGDIHQMIKTIMKSFQSTSTDGGLLAGSITLNQIWTKAEAQPVSAGSSTSNLPYPKELAGYVDGMSTIGGYAKGMSGIETQKLNYAQKRYFLATSFLKSLFGYFHHQGQTPIGKQKSN